MKIHDIRAHVLRVNHRCEIPGRMVVLDTETEDWTPRGVKLQRARLGWTVYAELGSRAEVKYESWNAWMDRYKMVQYLEGLAVERGTLWIVGNNIFFDLQAAGFFPCFAGWGWKLDFCYENQLTYMLICSRERSILKVVSLTNYYAASVKDLGEMLGKPKLEVDFRTSTPEELSVYCRRDTEITYEAFLAWVRFVVEDDLGNFSLSRAAQSMAAFRHRFMTTQILIHQEKDIRELEGRAYFGGRTEAFFIGKPKGGPFVQLDVNSMYPFVMKWRPMPCALNDVLDNPSLEDCKWILRDRLVVADVELETDVPIYALREEEKILFPIGRFRTCLCSQGMREAIARDHLRKVYRLLTYTPGFLFEAYVDHFYDMRKEAKRTGDRVKDSTAKLMLNSLYGKFGEKRPASTNRSPCDPALYSREEIYDTVDDVNTFVTCLLGTRTEEIGQEYSPRSVVAIPAHVTEYGRMMLWSIMEKIGREKVLYCDTDSIIMRASDLDSVKDTIDATELGSLKIDAEYNALEIFTAKDYQTDTVRKLKGIPKNAKEIAPGTYTFPIFYSQKMHLTRRIDSGFLIEETTKMISGEYDKGIVFPDGHVEPFTLTLSSPAPSRQPEL